MTCGLLRAVEWSVSLGHCFGSDYVNWQFCGLFLSDIIMMWAGGLELTSPLSLSLCVFQLPCSFRSPSFDDPVEVESVFVCVGDIDLQCIGWYVWCYLLS